MGEEDVGLELMCGKNGNKYFLLFLIRMAGGVLGSMYLTLYCAPTCPIALLMSYTFCLVNVSNELNGKGVISYILFMILFNLAWVNALTEYDSR